MNKAMAARKISMRLEDCMKKISLKIQTAALHIPRLNLYKEGKGVEKDINTIIKLYEKAAEKNYHHASNNLGDLYRLCKIVEKDYNKALTYYRKSAEHNNTYAFFFYDAFMKMEKVLRKITIKLTNITERQLILAIKKH